jgi:NAD-specific glutamate dehydrogenase
MAKTTTERIESVQKEIEQLQNRKKSLLQTENREKRKARTKRLIERGLIAEKLVPNAESLTNDEFREALYALLRPADDLEQNAASEPPCLDLFP